MEKNKYIQIYKGKYCDKKVFVPYANKINKVFVFDLDETIGSFKEFIILLKGIECCKEYFEIKPTENEDNNTIFNELLDLYPEFLRYGILTIFEFLKYKKENRDCSKIFIYTNNIFSPKFPLQIKKYFDYKLNTKDFIDQIINAFKVNNKIIEPNRTTNKKTISDFFNCTLLPNKTEICFIDNTYYSKMKNEKIFYIQPKSYYHNLSKKNILQRFFLSDFCKTRFLENEFLFFLEKYYENNIFTIRMRNNSFSSTSSFDELLNVSESSRCNSENENGNDNENDNEKEKEKESNPSSPNNNDLTRDSPIKKTNTEINIYVSKKLLYHIKEFFYMNYMRTKTKKNRFRIGNFTRKVGNSRLSL